MFERRYAGSPGPIEFTRDEIIGAAQELGLPRPKNIGDIVYTFRYRKQLPDSIKDTTPKGKEWVIEGAGSGRYRFRLTELAWITPRTDLLATKIPDATPEIVAAHALSDEQALLAKMRYNRLVDIFLGIAACSLQNHLRTYVEEIGQIEVDELYVGVNRNGVQFVIPVQAKGSRDQIGVVQTKQDIACCARKFPRLVCRPVAAQFVSDDIVAMFELTQQDEQVKVVNEKHYKLVPADSISDADIKRYREITPSG